MKRILLLVACLYAALGCVAQMPPSNMYDNLSVYRSVAVYEDGEQVPFNGTDYFYVDHDDDGDVWVLFCDPYDGWMTTSADFIEQTYDYTKYSVTNPAGEELIFIISPDGQDVMATKDGEDITIAYALLNSGGSYSVPSYGGGYNGGGYGGYSTGSGSGSSSSGRTCAGCRGTGKCTMCNGDGWYYQETGYYTGNTRKEKTTCPSCHGTGRCGTCHGNGTIR